MSPRAAPEQRPRSQGHCLAAAAGRLGIEPTVVMPVRTPLARRSAIARAGAKVIIHADSDQISTDHTKFTVLCERFNRLGMDSLDE